LSIVLPALVAIFAMAWWLMWDAATTVAFDLGEGCLSVRSERPWFGPAARVRLRRRCAR